MNEEMYEEEDDDLPLQYRRLTAHLQTGSADFNRRLAAYLTNHVAMRSALDQAITNSYAQQYPNAPQFAHNQQTMFPSPLVTHGLPQQAYRGAPQSAPLQSPHPYRQSPYPTPGTPGYRHHPHNRSTSIAQPLDGSAVAHGSPVDAHRPPPNRRMSMPAPSAASPAAAGTTQPLQPSSKSSTPKSTTNPLKQESSTPPPTGGMTSHPMGPPTATAPASQPPAHYTANAYADLGPFSTSLPMESQMMLGSTLNPADPLTSMLMAGSENMAQPMLGYNHFSANTMNMNLKQSGFHPSYDGMSATLAPSALDMSPQSRGYSQDSTATGVDATAAPSFNYNFDNNFGDYKGSNYLQFGSGADSGTVTPGVDGGWDAFIDNSWVENQT